MKVLGVLTIVLLTACAPEPLRIPAAEAQLMLDRRSELGIDAQQAGVVQSMLHDTEERQETLDRHLDDDGDELWRLLAKSRHVDSPALWAQAGLVHQLRFERLFTVAALREQTRKQLTDPQRARFDALRRRLVFHGGF